MTKPKFNVPDETKLQMAQQLIGQMMFSLDRLSPDGSVLADDFLDLLALCAGIVIENDSNLNTPQKLRLGAATVAAHVERHAKTIRAVHTAEGGESTLTMILATYEVPEEVKRAWDV